MKIATTPLVALFLYSLFVGASLAATGRTFTINNYCSDTIWFQLTPGATGPAAESACVNGRCMSGATCNTLNNLCYWNTPTPSSGNFQIASSESTTVTFPYVNNGQDTWWSGNIGGCINGTCASDSTFCNANGCGTIGGAPQTRAEFTLQKTSNDFYDVEVINGLNLAMEMVPLVSNTLYNPADPYFCGNPGGVVSNTGAGNCTWSFDITDPYYVWVSAGGSTCSSNGDCNKGGICGLSVHPGYDNFFQLTCGSPLGYFTADQVCGVKNIKHFDCDLSIENTNPGLTLTALYLCQSTQSCYHDGSTSSCCGCANWNESGIFTPANTQRCVSENSNWTEYVKPNLLLLKTGCPTAYTFPYDDASSTFQCADFSNELNTVNYEINFCPERRAARRIQCNLN